MVRSLQVCVLLFLSLFSFSYAQTPEWKWFFQNNSIVSSIVEDDSSFWFASNYGLMSLGKTSGVKNFYYKLNSGIPANNVTDMAMDSNKVKWLAIHGKGLVKFDGKTWTTYDSSNSPLPDDYLFSVAAEGNTIWAGGLGAVSSFDGSKWKVYTPSNSAIPGRINVNSIHIDKNGVKWFATEGGGLIKFDGVNWTTYTQSNSILPSNYIHDLASNDSSGIWIAALGGLLNLNGTKWTGYDMSNSQLASDVVTAVRVDKKGVVWVGTNAGSTASFDGTSWVTYYSSPYSKIDFNTGYYVFVASDNSKLLSGDMGKIARYDGKDWSVINVSSLEMPESPVYSLLLSRDKSKWLANNSGLVHLTDSSVVSYTTKNSSIPGNYVYSIAEENSGKIWVGTNLGLASFDGKNWEVFDAFNSPLTSNNPFVNNIYHVLVDKDSTKWVSQNNTKLFSLKGDKWTTYSSSNSTLSTWPVMSIAVDSSGTKWISTQYEMLTVSGDKWTKIPFTSQGTLLTMKANVAFDKSGAAWTGAEWQGLARYNGTDYSLFPFSASIPAGAFETFAFDTAGSIWCGFGGAMLAKFTPQTGKWHTISPAELGLLEVGVPGDVYKIVVDKNNTKYFCTNIGVLELKGDIKDEVVSHAEGTDSKLEDFRLYQNYPNPFNPVTTISYSIPRKSHVSLKVYNAIGREVAVLENGQKPAGTYSVKFNASNFASGIYFCRIEAGQYSAVKKLVLLK